MRKLRSSDARPLARARDRLPCVPVRALVLPAWRPQGGDTVTRPGAAPAGLLTTSEVAAAFRVSRGTVRRWDRTGRLTCIRTLGGHRRYRQAEVRALLRREDAR